MEQDNIKKNLIELYSIMYNMANNEYAKSLFSKDILNLLKSPISDIEGVLTRKYEFSLLPRNEIRTEITEINSSEKAIQYFKKNIAVAYLSDSKDVVTAFTLKELKLLYGKIFGIELYSSKMTRNAIIEKIMEYINSETRTADLAKDLV